VRLSEFYANHRPHWTQGNLEWSNGRIDE